MKTFKQYLDDAGNKLANHMFGAAPDKPAYKVGQDVSYEMHPPQKDGHGRGVIKSYSNGHYMINDKPINHHEITKVHS